MAGKRKAHDWEAIERDWRTGKFTLRELEKKHGVDNAVISRRMKADKAKDASRWQKDLAKVVRQATSAALMQATVSKMVSEGQQSVSNDVLAAAELNKQVIMAHRGELAKLRQTANALLDEVIGARLSSQEAELLAQILAGDGATPADVDKAREAIRKSTARASRVGDVKALSEVVTKVQAGERIAYGLNDAEDEEQGFEDFLRSLGQ